MASPPLPVQTTTKPESDALDDEQRGFVGSSKQAVVMELPSQREIELEMLLREREKQVAELTDEVFQLRRHLTTQSPPVRSESVSLPPPMLALLQPYVAGQPSSPDAQRSGSSTMTAGLIQRTRVLQTENDELYEMLRSGETGKLKEEVRCLKNVVTRMERALADSSNAITSLTEELDKSHKEFLSRHNVDPRPSRRDSPSPPRQSTRTIPPGSPKAVPTGPRAHKKQRLNDSSNNNIDTRNSPARSNVSMPASNANSTLAPAHPNRTAPRRDRSPRGGSRARSRRSPAKDNHRMDIDSGEEQKLERPGRTVSQDKPHEREGLEKEKDKEREKEHQRQRDRDHDRARQKGNDRDRDRDSERHRDRERDRSKKNGTHGGGRSGGGKRAPARNSNAMAQDGDRSLAERMGLK